VTPLHTATAVIAALLVLAAILTAAAGAGIIATRLRLVSGVSGAKIAIGSLVAVLGVFSVLASLEVLRFSPPTALGLGVLLVAPLALLLRWVLNAKSITSMHWIAASIPLVIVTFIGVSSTVRWPTTLPSLVGKILGRFSARESNHESIRIANGEVRISDLPSALWAPGVSSTDRNDFAVEGRPSLTLENSTLIIGNVDGQRPMTLMANTLTLVNSTILTNGNPLLIRADKFISRSGRVLSFRPLDDQPPAAEQGANGRDGRDGGEVILDVRSEIVGDLDIDLHGQSGGTGGAGTPGPPGRPGARGADAADGLFDCRRGGADGQPGESGQAGSPGGSGGSGGNGGHLVLFGAKAGNFEHAIHFQALGGHAGEGGQGGPGGMGGAGGDGGSGSVHCGGGHAGAPGQVGPEGPHGNKGEHEGRTGQEIVKPAD